MSHEVSVDLFVEFLSEEPDWYTFGVFLGVPSQILKEISRNYRFEGTMRCLIELHESYTKSCEELLSWEVIVSALQRKKNVQLANKLHSKFIKPDVAVSSHCNERDHQQDSTEPSVSRQSSSSSANSHVAIVRYEAFNNISNEFELLSNKFESIVSKIKNTLKTEQVSLGDIQDLIRRRCGLPCIPEEAATFEAVFSRIEDQCSIVSFHPLVALVENLLRNKVILKRRLKKFKKSVDCFNASANMIELVALIKSNKCTSSDEENSVKLKVREFWSRFTMKQFETIINEIFQTLYDYMSHIHVSKGCICISWIVPKSINVSGLVPVLSLELIELLGVISLHIGSKVIYNVEGEGCEVIEAAMLQAVELKNMRAVELLLSVGCDPVVALMSDNTVITSIVNIKDDDLGLNGGSAGGHICVLGHNEHVEAIINPDQQQIEDRVCDTCRIKDKLLMQAHKEIEYYRQKQETMPEKLDVPIERKKGIAHPTDTKLEKESPPTGPSNKSLQEAVSIEENWKSQVARIEDSVLKEIVDQAECEKIPFMETVTDDKMIRTWLIDEHDIEYIGENMGDGPYCTTDLAMFHGTEVVAREPYSDKNRLIRSICISAVIRHPNIVQFIGATHYSLHSPVTLYEKMDINLITNLLSSSTQGSAYSRALDVGCDIGSALSYLHSFKPNPIIHRHLSFTTILINSLPTGKLKYKLSAFEAANIDCHATKDKCNNAGLVLIAPEADHHHSPAMDVYSLGVVLMITIVFADNHTPLYFQELLEQDPLLIASDKISMGLMKETIQCCLSKNYYDRPTASKLLQELKKMYKQLPNFFIS